MLSTTRPVFQGAFWVVVGGRSCLFFYIFYSSSSSPFFFSRFVVRDGTRCDDFYLYSMSLVCLSYDVCSLKYVYVHTYLYIYIYLNICARVRVSKQFWLSHCAGCSQLQLTRPAPYRLACAHAAFCIASSFACMGWFLSSVISHYGGGHGVTLRDAMWRAIFSGWIMTCTYLSPIKIDLSRCPSPVGRYAGCSAYCSAITLWVRGGKTRFDYI